MHLNPGELVDIADGTRGDDSAPHLAACDACRAQLRELRAMMTTAKDVEVPEPSPLFWDHLSSRVREAVAADAAPRASWRGWLVRRRGFLDPMLAAGAAAVLIAVVVGSRVHAPGPLVSPTVYIAAPPPAAAIADATAPAVLLDDAALQNDASLMLVASVSDGVDFDTAREAGLAPNGSAEHAITHMNDAELRELRRLLTEELARSGA